MNRSGLSKSKNFLIEWKPLKVGNEFKSILDVIDNGKELADLFENTKNLTEEERLNCLKI